MTEIDVPDSVLAEIEKHAFSEVGHEVGGVLYGTLSDSGTLVAGAFPALKATADQTSVTFTHEVWDEVHAKLDAEHPDQRIVGWYHTHPGFGIFLSEYDLFIHRNFFSDSRMVALVVDPVAGESGWFVWRDGEVEPTRKGRTKTPAIAPAMTTTVADVKRSRRNQVVPVLVLLGLLLAAGGFALGNGTAPDPAPSAQSSTDVSAEELAAARAEADALRTESDELRGRASDLQAQLAQANKDRAATFTYRVRSGDTLSAIAAFLYGDGTDYSRIVKTNPGLVVDELAIGQELVLPIPDGTGD